MTIQKHYVSITYCMKKDEFVYKAQSRSDLAPRATHYCYRQHETAGVNRKKPISELAASFEPVRPAGRCRALPPPLFRATLRHPPCNQILTPFY
ncbi:hypothetical protein J6590_003381 [Homalodisca vitripennis]|nr:hypothetical protein J6590_003381 [Homalodisca vitripennis]